MAFSIHSDAVLTPPLPAATVMVLRDGPHGLEVLMVRRHGNSGVLGGVHVFPGGKLDAADAQVDSAALERPGAECLLALAEPGLEQSTAVALHVAAVRETFEECGLLLGQPATAQQLQGLREQLLGGTGFVKALQQTGLRLPLASLWPWARWVTPRVASVSTKRFDTRFFVASAPLDQRTEHCAFETTEAVWLSPRTGLERCWAGEIDLAPPQIMTLSQFNRLGSVAEVLAAARSRSPALIEPEPFDEDGCRVICYPGDPRHSVRERLWPGPTRLSYRNQRFEAEGGLEALLG